MKSRLHTRVRPFRVAACLGCAFALVLGLSSTSASAKSLGGTKMVVTSTSPAEPTAGQTFTMKFELRKLGVPLHLAKAACYGTVARKLAKLVYQGTDGTVGTCSWAIPTGTNGKTFDGILAVQRDTGAWWYYGFDLAIR